MPELYPHQLKAADEMHNGCILCGGVGTGKSRTALYYYITKVCDGECKVNGEGRWRAMRSPRPLFIITTAKKRDDKEWIEECLHFSIFPDKVVVDSWNNIKKYRKVHGAFFIFDEQRVVGSGAWVKAFLDITRKNLWVLLSATPGDNWKDYIPVFIANGFYKNKTEFNREHVIYDPYVTRYPKIRGYTNKGRLVRYRNQILVNMRVTRETVRHREFCLVGYDRNLYKKIWVDRWNPYEGRPIEEVSALIHTIRKAVNSDSSRVMKLMDIVDEHKKIIIFYNFDFERCILEEILYSRKIPVSEWNGKRHEPILRDKESWAYLVQYNAGSEGWNCIDTDTIIFYSLNYSYRMMEQAAGRIDRANTPFKDLYYYYLISASPIDKAIRRALSEKKNFNESAFIGR